MMSPAIASLLPQNILINPSDYHQCPKDIPLSCNNDTIVTDSCCFEYPGGVLLQTQFWDYYPPVGPDNKFTLHGLWPDKCDGSYEQFCDDSQNIDSARSVLEEFNETKLLDRMNAIWKNYNGNDDQLWVHEFNKHGTCMSTIKPGCYSPDSFKQNQNVVDFYRTTVNTYEKLDTFKWLEESHIVPSNDQTYTRSEIEKCLSEHFGKPVYISCNKYNALQEVWYFHQLKGSILTGKFVPIPAMLNSRCPQTGIKFLPKNFVPPTPTRPGRPGVPQPTGGKFLRGFLKPVGKPGCIISNGHWYSSGSCATFRLIQAPFGGYNLKSSKGFCTVDSTDQLVCGRNITPKQFQYDKSTRSVSFGGHKGWSANHTPGSFKQVPIYAGKVAELQFSLQLQAY